MKALTLQVTIDPETGELHTLDGCPGFHPDIQKTCGPSSVACLDGAIWDMPGHSGGTNALLAHIELLVGSHQVMGLSGLTCTPSDPGSSVRLYVNDALFRLEGKGQTQPVWAVIVKDRSEESLYVSVYLTLEDALVAYRREVTEIYGETECSMDLMDHGLGEPCECDQPDITPGDLDLRALLPRSEHSLVSTYPEALCMCGTQLGLQGLDEHPTLGEHLDAVIDQPELDAVIDQALQQLLQAYPESERARLAAVWQDSLADLVIFKQHRRGDLAATEGAGTGRRINNPE